LVEEVQKEEPVTLKMKEIKIIDWQVDNGRQIDSGTLLLDEMVTGQRMRWRGGQ